MAGPETWTGDPETWAVVLASALVLLSLALVCFLGKQSLAPMALLGVPLACLSLLFLTPSSDAKHLPPAGSDW